MIVAPRQACWHIHQSHSHTYLYAHLLRALCGQLHLGLQLLLSTQSTLQSKAINKLNPKTTTTKHQTPKYPFWWKFRKRHPLPNNCLTEESNTVLHISLFSRIATAAPQLIEFCLLMENLWCLKIKNQEYLFGLLKHRKFQSWSGNLCLVTSLPNSLCLDMSNLQ